MISELLTYEDKIGLALYNLKEDEIFNIEEKVALDNREKFVTIVKQYIDGNFRNDEGYYIQFSNDYKRIKIFSLAKLISK